jgi:type IV secretory pathway TrbD component
MKANSGVFSAHHVIHGACDWYAVARGLYARCVRHAHMHEPWKIADSDPCVTGTHVREREVRAVCLGGSQIAD